MDTPHTRVGIFGWGIVAPKSPTVADFERNLERATHWLEPFTGFGPSNFLVGNPSFDFAAYRPWIDARFEPRKFAQLDAKMGDMVKYAIGAFIQALERNPGMEALLRELGTQAHVYVGTGLGDLPLQYEIGKRYLRGQLRWNRFWCRSEHHPELAAYRAAPAAQRQALRTAVGAPLDPAELDPEAEGFDEAVEAWLAFWVSRSEGLRSYLREANAIEAEGVGDDVEASKGHTIRRKLAARRRLNQKTGCPPEPWTTVDPRLLWNIPNIPAAQISMLAGIKGTAVAPVAACAGFGTALKLAVDAIRLGEAKVAVVGMTDPAPHPLTVGAFFEARVVSADGEVSRPFTSMRGTHVAGGACIWIVGDAAFLRARGMKTVGLEVLGVALSADADHIITPSEEGPLIAIRKALGAAGVGADQVATWDMHATSTPGDWQELKNALSIFSGPTSFTARKGSFGHGMSVCGGWELTAQHLGVARGVLHPVDVGEDEIHPQIRPFLPRLVRREPAALGGRIAGKINMGIGGTNACVICAGWESVGGGAAAAGGDGRGGTP